MKTKWILGSCAAVLFLVCGCGGAPGTNSTLAPGTVQASSGFTAAAVSGGYAFFLYIQQPLFGTAPSIGVFTADGAGQITAGELTENSQSLSCHGTFSGTYSVNTNGTGMLTTTSAPDTASAAKGCQAETIQFALALAQNGQQMSLTARTNSLLGTTVVAGSAVRQ